MVKVLLLKQVFDHQTVLSSEEEPLLITATPDDLFLVAKRGGKSQLFRRWRLPFDTLPSPFRRCVVYDVRLLRALNSSTIAHSSVGSLQVFKASPSADTFEVHSCVPIQEVKTENQTILDLLYIPASDWYHTS